MTAPASRQRIFLVDLARGAALVGMVVYHLAWDLHAFGFSAVDPGRSLPWHLFGQTVASTFLFLSGLSLVLAHRRDGGSGRAFRRLALVAVAAATVTGVTAVATPGQTIVFGILHCIALGNLLALPLLAAPAWLVAGLALLAFAVPALVPAGLPPGLWWLGLSSQIPDTLDVRPLLPWVGVIFLGVAFGQINRPARWRRLDALGGRWGRAVATAGRHTLLIYLVHQPVLFAAFSALGYFVPSPREGPIQSPAFISECQRACVANDTDPERCAALCRCVQRNMADMSASGRLDDALAANARSCATVAP